MTGAEILDRLEADGILRVLRCEHVTEAWGPNEGCREFMTEPETWACDANATHAALYDDFDEDGIGPAVMHLCGAHAFGLVLDDIERGPWSPFGRVLVVML